MDRAESAGGGVAILSRMVREGFTEKVLSELCRRVNTAGLRLES